MSVEVRRVRDDDELAAALALRVAVFAGEQGVRPDADRDGHDHEALHLVAVDPRGEVLGTCRLLVVDGVARLGRLVVAREARRRGIGAALLAEADREAAAAGARGLRLHAQTDARPIYDRAGYRPVGPPFEEEGIEHVTMEKHL